ncbi:MAG: glutaredoxin domain-containing protein [Propionibacteriaceae bacterium]
MRSLVRRWWPAVLIAACGVWFVVSNVASGHPVAGAVVGIALAAIAWGLSPLIFPRDEGWTESERRARTSGVPLILWKPGCSWCIRMRIALGRAGGRAVWVDIERDPEAAAQTRARNDGDETTPTVIALAGTRTNPSPAWVRDQLPR